MAFIARIAISMFCTSGTWSKVGVGLIAPFLPGVLQICCFLTIFLTTYFILKSKPPNKYNSTNYTTTTPTVDSNTAAKWAAIFTVGPYYLLVCTLFILLLFALCVSPVNRWGDMGALMWKARDISQNPSQFVQGFSTPE